MPEVTVCQRPAVTYISQLNRQQCLLPRNRFQLEFSPLGGIFRCDEGSPELS